MNKINIQKWNKFHLYDEHMFYIDMGNKFDKSKMDTTKNDINFVGRTGINNGINATCSKYNNVEPYESGLLTLALGGSVGSCFIQQKPFYTSQNVIVLIPKDNISDYAKHFVARVIQKESELHYQAFVKELNAHIKTDFVIPLPTTPNGEPDWEYMESYMKNIMQESERDIENLKNICNKKKEIELNNWKSFTIGKLFENIVKPPVLHTKNVTENINGIPYVVRTKFNNGIKYNVEKTLQMQPSPAGTISFGAENATFFYQEREYVSGRDIYYIDTRHLTKYACLFVVTSLQTIAEKYSYNYGMFPELVKKEEIKLPVNKKGEPDWDYMENYMKNIMQNTQSKLDKLVCC